MGVYPSAASQIQMPRDPSEGIRNAVSLRGMMQQQAVAKQDAEIRAQQAQQDAQLRAQQAQQDAQLKAQQIQQGQAAQKDQDVWRQAYRDNDGDPDKAMAQAIKNAASGASIEAFQRHQSLLKGQLAQTSELELRNLATRYGNMRSVLEPLWDEINKSPDKPQGQDGEPPPELVSAHPGLAQNPVSIRRMMLGKGGQWQGDQPGPAEPGEAASAQRKQDIWTKQRELVLAHPDAYGITDLSQAPVQYPGDDFVRDLYAMLAGGHQLVQKDLARRKAGAAPEGSVGKSPTEIWIMNKGEWVPLYGNVGETKAR